MITGLVVGIIVATQAGDFERADFDLPDIERTGLDELADDDDGQPGDEQSSDEQAGKGQAGAGPPGPDMTGAIISVDGATRPVALTFSAGPDPTYTPQVLDVLDRHEVRATFCVIGEAASDHPELIRRIAGEGHTLCSHGQTHDFQLAERDDDRIEQEISGGRNAIVVAAPGVAVPFFRAPGGEFSPQINAIAESYDQQPLGWSVDPHDWESPGAAVIVDAVLDVVRPGDVIVLHDGGGDRSDTVAALDTLITDLRNEGYEFVTP